jgi:hypothetical protein
MQYKLSEETGKDKVVPKVHLHFTVNTNIWEKSLKFH